MRSGTARVAVLGASGFTGGELIRLLAAHPAVELTFLGAKGSAGARLGDVHPHLAGVPGLGDRLLEPLEPGAVADRADVAFCALPHGASAELAPPLLEAGLRVIDLGGDFRLPPEAYPEWYGFEHPAPAWLGKAVYGLPELFADRVAGAELVANPGCYPTPVVLGLAPLLAAGLLEPGPVFVDGKSGVSGAGKGPSEATSHASTEESVRPYAAPRHRHTPEMERGIELATGLKVQVAFVPHLVPAVRGVLTTAAARLAEGVATDDLVDRLREAYAGQPFVRVLPPGAHADTKRTRGANLVELEAFADPRSGTAVVVGALDNLVKGAAGQAVQNLNLALGLDQATALPAVGVYP
ncbi:MAG TPA: N-acetyl-gamma-glutamyl-phosphate reductase [Actinomycetota bacterium]|nr:N-acetyl-gamma-glutamyl-phosphate reductase [Actinomycetota bacterium]